MNAKQRDFTKNVIFEALDNHCVKNVRIHYYSGPHFFRIFLHSDWIRRDILRIPSYSVRMRENAGKMRTMDTFYAVDFKVSQSIFEK